MLKIILLFTTFFVVQNLYANNNVHDLRVGQTFVEFSDGVPGTLGWNHPYDDEQGELKVVVGVEKSRGGDLITYQNYCPEECLREDVKTKRVTELEYEKFDLNELDTIGRGDNGYYHTLGFDYTHNPNTSLFESHDDFKVGTKLIYNSRGHDGNGSLSKQLDFPKYSLVTIVNLNIMRNNNIFVAFWDPSFGTLKFLSINFAKDHEMLQRSYEHRRKLFKYNPTDSVSSGSSVIKPGDEITYIYKYGRNGESSCNVETVTASGFAVCNNFSKSIIFLDIWMR